MVCFSLEEKWFFVGSRKFYCFSSEVGVVFRWKSNGFERKTILHELSSNQKQCTRADKSTKTILVNENAEGGNISSSCNISTVILDTPWDSNALDFLQNNTTFAGLLLLMNII